MGWFDGAMDVKIVYTPIIINYNEIYLCIVFSVRNVMNVSIISII